MKKKLFATAFIVALYSLFVIVLSGADNQGNVEMFLSDIGLSNTSSNALPGTPSSDSDALVCFRDPIPAPSRKPPAPPLN